MNNQEKTLVRILFENKIYKANGQAYEDLFTAILSEAEDGFRKIKAWGNVGDQKNDGYIETKGVYYQVFAPEDIKKSYPKVVTKIGEDFDGLKKEWENIQEYYFVINDKFQGVNVKSEKTITQLKENHSLKKSAFFTADNLMRKLLALDDDFIQKIVGFLPDIEQIKDLNWGVLDEVIGHIMKQPIPISDSNYIVPDWDEKVQFNELSSYNAKLLNNGSFMQGELDKFLKVKTSLADELQKQMTKIYVDIKEDWKETNAKGDNIFWEIVNQCLPKNESQYQNPVLTIMAKYFETCDIFEEPK